MGKVVMDKKVILLFLLLLLFCTSRKEEPITWSRLEGWAGNPDNPNEKPFDYFYMKAKGRASEKAINKKNGEMMKGTCTDAATTKVKGDLIGKMIGETVQCNGITGQRYNLDDPAGNKFYFQIKQNKMNILNFIAIRSDECLVHALYEEYQRIIQSVGTKDCKPLAIPDQENPLSEWKECECIVYAHIQGGRDAIIKRANEIERE